MFGTKPKQAMPAPEITDRYAEEHKRDLLLRADLEAERARLQATVDATTPPADIYRITKDFETGQFIVSRWVNRLDYSWAGSFVYHQLNQGHEAYPQRFPSAAAARAFIKALIDPKTNLQGFDADGEPVELSGER